MANSVDGVKQSVLDQYGVKKSSGENTGDDLSKDAFLNLLVTQLRYQDPLNPMENKDFLAQMAQFSALEQMQNLNSTVSMSQGYALLGKTVQGSVVNPATLDVTYVEGVVSAVSSKSGEIFLTIGDNLVPLERVEAVLPDAVAKSQGYDLLGKTIQGSIIDPKTLEITKVEGVVSSVTSKAGEIFLTVGDKLVPLDNLEAVLSDTVVEQVEDLKETVTKIKEQIDKLVDGQTGSEGGS